MARINKEGHIIYSIVVVTKDKGRRIRQSIDRAIIPGHPDYHDRIVWLPPDDCELAENLNNQAIASDKRIINDDVDKQLEAYIAKLRKYRTFSSIDYLGCGVLYIDCRYPRRLQVTIEHIEEIARQIDPDLIVRESTLEPDSNNWRLVMIEYKQAVEQNGE